ncbi:MAG: LytTR family DNA-binding domain-containing protein [Candidatus Eisenbacteria bacterium]|uniref:Response regulator transcription factor n=1 Tax=Eiseniibacteriota bacterium TaxID=2212470 RepID=A0A956RNC4_UNCEI|nr:response regulator transcription factor [Candidatus Eisenbacteria bacterium]
MVLRALIIDDEPPARRRLRTLLGGMSDIEVVGEASDGSAAVEETLRLEPDLLLLDIQMPGMDGFDVLEEIADRGPRPLPAVIFVTAHDEHALRAFEAHAVDYLLKPFDQDRLRLAVDKAARLRGSGLVEDRTRKLIQHTLAGRPLRRLMVRGAARIEFVAVEEIDWIEADGHYVLVHARETEYLIRESIRGLCGRLDPSRFARIHRRILVNLDRIHHIETESHGDFEVLLKDGQRLHGTRTWLRGLTERFS